VQAVPKRTPILVSYELSIEPIVDSNKIAESILIWCHDFRADDLFVEDIQDRIATLEVSGAELPQAAQKRLVQAHGNSMPFGGACGKRASALRLDASSANLKDS
jgi:hypothetical protein